MTFHNFELGISFALFGIIWLIQLVHYPSFLFYHRPSFREAMKHHQDRISLVIVPLMLTELIFAGMGIFRNFTAQRIEILTVVLMIWTITFMVHVPLHSKLMNEEFNEKNIKFLVKTNWSRTLLWTIKLGLVLLKF